MFHRCVYCHRIIWPLPWVHMGWHVRRGDTVYWHAKCRRDLSAYG